MQFNINRDCQAAFEKFNYKFTSFGDLPFSIVVKLEEPDSQATSLAGEQDRLRAADPMDSYIINTM